MKVGNVYFTSASGKRVLRCSTHALKGGGFLHFDKIIEPISFPSRLGAVPPLVGKDSPPPTHKPRRKSGKAEKRPTAEARK